MVNDRHLSPAFYTLYHENEVAQELRRFIICAATEGWIERDNGLECGYRFISCQSIPRSGGCALILVAFTNYLIGRIGKTKRRNPAIPWQAFSSIFLNSGGSPWTSDALKTKITKLYQKDAEAIETLLESIRAEISSFMKP